jgi:hypothetical protein
MMSETAISDVTKRAIYYVEFKKLRKRTITMRIV